jgi:hypothetical protein
VQELVSCVSKIAECGVDVDRVWLRTCTEDFSSPSNVKFCSKTNGTTHPVSVKVLIEKSRKIKFFFGDITVLLAD